MEHLQKCWFGPKELKIKGYPLNDPKLRYKD